MDQEFCFWAPLDEGVGLFAIRAAKAKSRRKQARGRDGVSGSLNLLPRATSSFCAGDLPMPNGPRPKDTDQCR